MRSLTVFFERSADRDLERLPADVRAAVLRAIDRYAATGVGDVKRLKDVRPPRYRLRVGSYRVLFAIDAGAMIVEVVRDRGRMPY